MTAVPLTDQQLADIRAREAAATRGPWGYFDGDNYAALGADYQQTGRGSYTCRQGIARLEEDDFWDDQANEGRDEGDAYEQMIANVEFITHARTDVPALLAELDRLRAERDGFADRVDTLTAVAKSNKLAHRIAAEECDRLTAELEQARQQTEAAHCRLHFIAERVGRLDISDDPTGVAGDVGPYLDGPLHPLDLADYRAAMNSATPVEICEIPHATVEEEDACEQQRLAEATQSST